MSKASRIELLPSPAEIARQPVQRAELDRLVQEKVAEILHARDEFMFEPFFRSRQIANELRRLQTVPEQNKWQVYFQRFGCLICQTTERIHVGNGMCDRCYPNTYQRLKQILGELVKGEFVQPARGQLQVDRMLPAGAACDGVHHTRYQRSTKDELELFARVAGRLGVTPDYVRAVGVGIRRSEAVSKAIERELAKLEKKGSQK
jgi:hypothetical protein